MKKDTQTVRFLKWIREYPGWWYLICTPDDEHMTIDMMQMLIKRLAKEQFYEIIFVLLTVHKNSGFMKNIFDFILLEMLITEWKGNGKKQFVRNLTDLLN